MNGYSTVPDGTDSEHPFECLDKDGNIVTSVEKIKYRVLAKNEEVLTDNWIDITPPVPSGTIKVPGELNRCRDTGDTKRTISIVATHNGGGKKTGYINYALDNNPGVKTATDLSD